MNLLHPLNLDLNPGKEAANGAQGSMDQIREEQKNKIICSSSSQCHQIIRYQQKLAATEEEGKGIRQQRQKRVLLSSALSLGNGDTQNITIYTFLLLRKNVKIRLRVSVQNLLIISGFVLWVLTKYWQLNQWKETLQRRIWDIPGGAFNTDWMIISGVLLERYKPDRSVSEGKT